MAAIVRLGLDAPAEVGLSPWSVPRPFILNMQAAAALGYMPRTSYRQAVGPICDWLAGEDGEAWKATFPILASYPSPLFDYASEDKLRHGPHPPRERSGRQLTVS